MDVFLVMVQDEYKRFLVLKHVEMLAEVENLSGDATRWLEPSRPGTLVSLFWRAHRDAGTYEDDCRRLFSDIIAIVDPSDTEENCSSLSEKHQALFQFEQSFLKHNLLCENKCRVSNDKTAEVMKSLIMRPATDSLVCAFVSQHMKKSTAFLFA